jgi:hypothetical protein
LKQWAALALPVLWIVTALPLVYRSVHPSSFMKARSAMMASSYAQMVPLIQSLPGAVLSEDMTLLVKAGKPIPMEPSIFYNLAIMGILDQEPFLARLRRQEFSAIIVIHDFDYLFTPQMGRTITEHYQSAEQIGPFHLYRPIAAKISAAALAH